MATHNTYKVEVVADTFIAGRPHRAGETVRVSAEDAGNLIDSLRGRLIGKDDIHAIRVELRRDAERITKGGRRA